VCFNCESETARRVTKVLRARQTPCYKQKMPQVSVIITTRDRVQLLPHAIESAQKAGSDLEIIVVDDASTDATPEVCQKMTDIKYIRLDRNHGSGGARNVGLLNSESEYISFLDDDDRRLPGSIDFQLEALREQPTAGFACGELVIVDQDYQPSGEVIRPGLQTGDVFWNVLELNFPANLLSLLIRRECLLQVGLFREHLIAIEDWDILVRLSEQYPAVINHRPVGLYREATPNSDQNSSAHAAQLSNAARHQKELLQLPRAMRESDDKRRAVRRSLKSRIADTLLSEAATFLSKGYFSLAAQNIKVALRLSPARVCRPWPYRKLIRTLLGSTRQSKLGVDLH
jgi:glycosyltransferase involved in cell wall biosynthesis